MRKPSAADLTELFLALIELKAGLGWRTQYTCTVLSQAGSAIHLVHIIIGLAGFGHLYICTINASW